MWGGFLFLGLFGVVVVFRFLSGVGCFFSSGLSGVLDGWVLFCFF